MSSEEHSYNQQDKYVQQVKDSRPKIDSLDGLLDPKGVIDAKKSFSHDEYLSVEDIRMEDDNEYTILQPSHSTKQYTQNHQEPTDYVVLGPSSQNYEDKLESSCNELWSKALQLISETTVTRQQANSNLSNLQSQQVLNEKTTKIKPFSPVEQKTGTEKNNFNKIVYSSNKSTNSLLLQSIDHSSSDPYPDVSLSNLKSEVMKNYAKIIKNQQKKAVDARIQKRRVGSFNQCLPLPKILTEKIKKYDKVEAEANRKYKRNLSRDYFMFQMSQIARSGIRKEKTDNGGGKKIDMNETV